MTPSVRSYAAPCLVSALCLARLEHRSAASE